MSSVAERIFWPAKLSIALNSRRPVAGEFLRAVLARAGLDDRGDVVGAEIALDELLGGLADPDAAREVRLQVVEDQHEHPAVELLRVARHVGLDRGGREERRVRPLNRDVDQRHDRQVLLLAVLEDLEVILGQVADEAALRVGDDRVHLDVVDLGPERHRRRLLRAAAAAVPPGDAGAAGGRGRRGGLLRGQRQGQ